MRTPGVLSALRERLRDLATGDDGVALALALAFFLPAFMLVVCIYAVQETLWRKVQMQNAADAAAYSASVVQADYFNRIALVNKVLGWTYVNRERARMDYAMGHLVCRAEDVRKAELEACKNENNRACCGKRKGTPTYYGVGRSVSKSEVKCDNRYPKVNGLTNLPFQNFEKFVNSRCSSGSSGFFKNLESRIKTDGERMKLCNQTLERLQKEMDSSVERAANDILELNMDQSGARWFSQVFTPKAIDRSPLSRILPGKPILSRLECSADDEKNLFEAAGFDNVDPKKVFGPGADKWLVLASKKKHYNGPRHLGRDWEFCSSTPSIPEYVLVGLIAASAPGVFTLTALGTLYANERKHRPLDEKFKKTWKSTSAKKVQMGHWDGVGPSRVLDFGEDGESYLSGNIDFFWKRYGKASWWFFGTHHVCIYPLKVFNLDALRIGCHCKGSTRFSVYEDGKNGVKGMRGGQPAYGDDVPANGLKLTEEFFSEYGATRIFVARENANPLRVFGEPSASSKFPLTEEILKIVLRFDGEGLFGVFNSHLGNAGFDKEGTFDGPQRPNYMFALSASRVGYRAPDKKTYNLRQAKPKQRGAKSAWNLCCTDWESFLVPFRSVKLTGWEKESGTLSTPDPQSIWEKLLGRVSFEKEMRGLNVLDGNEGWVGHEPSLDSQGRVTGYKKAPLVKSLDGLLTLARMNDTRGPHPFKHGFTLLLWGKAEDYIQH